MFALVVLAGPVAALAGAQVSSRPLAAAGESGAASDVRIGANSRHLWLAENRAKDSRLYHRAHTGDFGAPRPLNGRIASLVPDQDGGVYVFFENNTIYRCYSGETSPRPELVLPKNYAPIDAVGAPIGYYAVVHTDALRALAADDDRDGAASQPFDPKDAELSIVWYDEQRWVPVAACPNDVRPMMPARLRPRLCLADRQLLLFYVSQPDGPIVCRTFDFDERMWDSATTIGIDAPAGFWPALVSGVPTLVTSSASEGAAPAIRVFRLLSGAGPAREAEWRPAKLDLSPLPEGVVPTAVSAAIGFNQNAGVLVHDVDGSAFVQFARPGSAPSEPTIATSDVFARRDISTTARGTWQMFTLLVLIGIFTVLFIFRRSSMTQTAALPRGALPAFAMQRLGGWLIDIVPFAIAAARVVNVSMGEAFRSIAELAFGSETRLPAQPVLLWWGLTIGGHTVYCLVMELIARRTVGKVFLQTRLLTERGERPGVGQVLVRNLTRLIELLPPFWIIGFLIMFTRNRQRFGDVLARTVVVRRVQVDASLESDNPRPGTGDDPGRKSGARGRQEEPEEDQEAQGPPRDDRSGEE